MPVFFVSAFAAGFAFGAAFFAFAATGLAAVFKRGQQSVHRNTMRMRTFFSTVLAVVAFFGAAGLVVVFFLTAVLAAVLVAEALAGFSGFSAAAFLATGAFFDAGFSFYDKGLIPQ